MLELQSLPLDKMGDFIGILITALVFLLTRRIEKSKLEAKQKIGLQIAVQILSKLAKQVPLQKIIEVRNEAHSADQSISEDLELEPLHNVLLELEMQKRREHLEN